MGIQERKEALKEYFRGLVFVKKQKLISAISRHSYAVTNVASRHQVPPRTLYRDICRIKKVLIFHKILKVEDAKNLKAWKRFAVNNAKTGVIETIIDYDAPWMKESSLKCKVPTPTTEETSSTASGCPKATVKALGGVQDLGPMGSHSGSPNATKRGQEDESTALAASMAVSTRLEEVVSEEQPTLTSAANILQEEMGDAPGNKDSRAVATGVRGGVLEEDETLTTANILAGIPDYDASEKEESGPLRPNIDDRNCGGNIEMQTMRSMSAALLPNITQSISHIPLQEFLLLDNDNKVRRRVDLFQESGAFIITDALRVREGAVGPDLEAFPSSPLLSRPPESAQLDKASWIGRGKVEGRGILYEADAVEGKNARGEKLAKGLLEPYFAPLRLALGVIEETRSLIFSLPGGRVQEMHMDFKRLRGRNFSVPHDDLAPFATLLALNDFHVGMYPDAWRVVEQGFEPSDYDQRGSHKRFTPGWVHLNAGECLVFKWSVVHFGGAYQHPQNLRLHAYWLPQARDGRSKRDASIVYSSQGNIVTEHIQTNDLPFFVTVE